MFSILLVILFVVVWVCARIIAGATKVVEGIGDPRDRVAKLNGSYHQHVLNGKKKLAGSVVAAKHSPDQVRSLASSVRSVAQEATRSASAEYHYRRRQKKAS